MKYLLYQFFSLGFTCIFITQSFAAISPDIEQRSVELLESGKPVAAYELLTQQNKTTAHDWFLYGMAAHKSGSFQIAEEAYREVLRLEPNSQRAKLELASVIAENQNWSEARRLLQEVKATNPPATVVQNIDRFLSVINEREAEYSQWRVRASAGVIYDSNVNSATSADVVTLFGLPFTLSEDAKAQSDVAYTLRYEADRIDRVNDRVSWQSNFSVNWTDYAELDRFDTLQLLASTGPVFQINSNTIFSLPISSDLVVFTDEGDIYSNSIGIAPQLRHKLSDEVTLNLNGSVSHRFYEDNSERNTTSYSFSPGLDFLSGCGAETFRVGASFGRDNSGIGIYSNDNWGLNASIFCPIRENTAVSLFASIRQADYDEREFAHPVPRADETRSIGMSIQHADQNSGLDFIGSATYTENESNLGIYTYDRFQGSLTVRKKF